MLACLDVVLNAYCCKMLTEGEGERRACMESKMKVPECKMTESNMEGMIQV